MPKSQIIIDLVEDAVPLEKSLTRLMVLAKDVKNKKLEEWAQNELNGYKNISDLPGYRRSHSSLFKYSGINGGFSVREYIQAMIDSGNEDITSEWVEWARKKADWYDPSIATEDEYLGKRQHEKSAEEKEKSLQDSIKKSWYW